ncbi:hypothetical protein [Pseudobacillus badius]|uniref:hypothetical protein n=1 Tax=Bacillus badius TaxID=1455 RepID=UPI0007B3B58A|nr:hypothetical protein [Bacillus badius]KZR56971.1 hypothetical protein A3781_04665 [Bacillus badius]
MMKNFAVTTMGNFFVAKIEGIEVMVMVIPTGFQTTLVRNGETVQQNDVSCFEDELRERVQESIIEVILNELEVNETDMDRITEELDSQLNDYLEGVVAEGEKAHKFTH